MSQNQAFFDEMESRIPHGKVRTRFAPSPTGYMHVGNLRTALYAYLIARRAGGTFLLRIEDTDQGRYVEGALRAIYDTLRSCGLSHDEGPDIGGPVGPYIQTERRDLYGKYAELLIKKGGAYRCFCTEERLHALREGGGPGAGKYDGHCANLSQREIDEKLAAGVPFVVRQKIPRGGTTTFSDTVFGDITVPNADLDDNVLIKSDGLPTYNFANVVDDHLMGITHVVRGSEYLSSAPKYNLLYEAFGWEVPVYVHCSPVMRDAHNKMSKRHGDPSYEDLIAMGYLSDAVVNYVALLGWSPGGEREIFSLSELAEVFDLKGISKSPAIFDLEKLNYFNATYLKALPPEAFFAAAEPYLKQGIPTRAVDFTLVAPLLQTRLTTLCEIPALVDFIEALPAYETELFEHKKMKSTKESSLAALRGMLPLLEGQADWTGEALYAALQALAERTGVKNSVVLWPLRVALSGKPSTPGGATELCVILGKEESIERVNRGIALLENQGNMV